MDTNQRAAKDLVEAFNSTTPWTLNILRILRTNLPLVEEADTEEGELACVTQVCIDVFKKNEEVSLDSKDAETLVADTMIPSENAIAELCNYLPQERGQLIDAAIAEAERKVAFERSWKQMQREVPAAIEGLGLRDKALVGIIVEIWDADANQGTDLLNDIADIVRDTPVDVLRTDPSLDGLLRIFDKARANLGRE